MIFLASRFYSSNRSPYTFTILRSFTLVRKESTFFQDTFLPDWRFSFLSSDLLVSNLCRLQYKCFVSECILASKREFSSNKVRMVFLLSVSSFLNSRFDHCLPLLVVRAFGLSFWTLWSLHWIWIYHRRHPSLLPNHLLTSYQI
jgi:hypothetical protein